MAPAARLFLPLLLSSVAAAAAPPLPAVVILDGRRVDVRSFSESMASAARRDEFRFGCSVALLRGLGGQVRVSRLGSMGFSQDLQLI